MSRAYSAWAKKVPGLNLMDRSVLREIADRVKDDGSWQFCAKDLAAVSGVSRSSLRRTLDRLAAMSLVAFKVERYREGEAQAGHRFILLRNEDELRSAEASGFSRSRQALERTSAEETKGAVGGSILNPGVGSGRTEGGFTAEPRVGPLLDPRRDYKNPLIKHERAPARRAIAAQGDLIGEDPAIHPGRRDLEPSQIKPPQIGGKRCTAEAFNEFWKVWPNRVGRPAALKAFARHAGEIDAILAGVERYIRDKPADRPWLNPATFLNQER